MTRLLRIFSAALVALSLFAIAGALGATRVSASALNSTATPSGPVDLKSGEEKLLADINWTRDQAGLPRLTLDATITAAARDRAADMANRHYFGHYNPDGKNFLDALKQWGVRYRMAAEIIAENNYAADQSPDEAHRGFLNSPPHKNIIMMNNWVSVGIGQSMDGSGMYYYSVLFVQPKNQ